MRTLLSVVSRYIACLVNTLLTSERRLMTGMRCDGNKINILKLLCYSKPFTSSAVATRPQDSAER